MVAMAKLCMGGENQPTQQGFGVLEFGDKTRVLGSATAGQSLKKHGPFFARKKLGIARSKHPWRTETVSATKLLSC